MNELDAIDIQILQLLQEQGRISLADLATQVNLTPPSVQRRVRMLEERGYIRGYVAIVDPLMLDLPVLAFMLIESAPGCDLYELADFLAQFHAVQSVHRLIGEWCFLLKVRTHSPLTLEQFINDIRRNPNVRRTHTTLTTSSPYDTTALPLPERSIDNEALS